MSNSEWPLLFFTLTAQLSVGAFLFWELPKYFSSERFLLKNISPVKPYLIFTLLAITALMISFLHLGKPFHAVYSLSNIKSSWLSREILLISLYSFMLIFYTILVWKKYQNEKVMILISGLTVISGLMMIYAMARIYMLQTVPSWNSPATIIEFYTASFLLGSVLTVFLSKNNSPGEAGIFFFTVVPVILLVKLISLIFVSTGHTIAENQFLLILVAVRGLLLFTGILLILFHLFRKKREKLFFEGNLFYFIALLFLFSELIGRYFFYAGFYTVGI